VHSRRSSLARAARSALAACPAPPAVGHLPAAAGVSWAGHGSGVTSGRARGCEGCRPPCFGPRTSSPWSAST
jgi:hypothetical protein